MTFAEKGLPEPDRFALRVLPPLALAFHLSTALRYGIFRDELYYIACGHHLAFGYVDHPPLVALVARVAHELFGTNLLGLRLFPYLRCHATAGTAQPSRGSLYIEDPFVASGSRFGGEASVAAQVQTIGLVLGCPLRSDWAGFLPGVHAAAPVW